MAESMFVRCEDCNYENLAQHSFCGMCGAKLPSPQRAARTAAADPQPAPKAASAPPDPAPARQASSGPSLLGLASEPTARERVEYLLEDEPVSGRWRGWVAILVLAAALGSGWYWRSEIRGWISRAPQTSSADPKPDVAPQAAATPENTTSNAAANPPGAVTTPAPTEAPATSAAAAPAPTTQTATPPAQSVTDAVARAPETKEQDSTMAPTTTQPTAPPAESPQAAPQPAAPKTERKAPATTDQSTDALETQGENYLYGHGVAADCGRAGKNLLAAAARSSAKAQSVLGTMYATGHCVTRDVPTAYRWFAKALHQDPGNVRIQQDLSVLWQQMTEEERKLAMQTGP